MLLYNSLTRTKEEFKPQKNKTVSLYVCGITPNNATRLGHAFTYVFFDVLVRYFQYKGYSIHYVQNATDVNDSDDVIKQAQESGKTWEEIADYWITHFQNQMKALNVLPPQNYVKASSVTGKIIEINKKLLDKHVAYEKNGTLYFDINKFPKYGELSRFTKEQMLLISKERGNNPDNPNKRNPLDFVLWFGSNETPNWKTPWGEGRPGWHIECNAIVNQYLGDQIDIHGGGRDLLFPHHESEIAQNEEFTGKSPYVKYWMYVGMVLYEGEKMSKSLGNLILVEDLLKKYSPDSIRWLLLCHYWRQPWEYDETELEEAEEKIQTIKKALNSYSSCEVKRNREVTKENSRQARTINLKQFEFIMDNDLYTPRLLEYIYSLAESKKNLSFIRRSLEILGFIL